MARGGLRAPRPAAPRGAASRSSALVERARSRFRVARAVVGRRAPAARASRASPGRASRATCSRSSTTARRSCSSCASTPERLAAHPVGRARQPRASSRPTPPRAGCPFDAMNSNTFQDQPGQQLHSYKFGSLTHPDAAVRAQAVEHNLQCIEIGREARLALASRSGSATAGTSRASSTSAARSSATWRACARSTAALPDGWRLFLEHKLVRARVLLDRAQRLGHELLLRAASWGERALSLVDLGHHAPNVNIEMIVARLIQFGKLAGFHFNDSKYGDDDLDSGSIKPFQLFLIFNELVDAELERVPGFDAGVHARPVAQRHRPARVADDERRRGGARLRAGAPRGPRGARRGAGGVRRARWRSRR